ncbi:MAG TPA: DUF3467 domain-containing protein [Streptosporangiaceae bacterium]
MNEPPAQPRIEFEPHADPALEAGVYANGLAIWHTMHEFTFDFFVSSQPPHEARTEEGERVIKAPHRLVARVRIPPTSVFDIIRTINQNLTLYEQKFGQIRTPVSEGPLYPPDDSGGARPGGPT